MAEKLEIKPHLLDLVIRDDDFVIYHGDLPIKTPKGKELASPTSRILKQILLELSMNPGLDLRSINAYSLLSYQLDFLCEGRDLFLENFEQIAEKDPFIQLKNGNKKQSQAFDPLQAQALFEHYPSLLPVIFWGVAGLLESFNTFLSPKNSLLIQPSDLKDKKVETVLRNIYTKLENYEKTVVNILSLIHESGIVLPLLLVGKYINASEYVNGLIAIHIQQRTNSVIKTGIENTLKELFNDSGNFPDGTNPVEQFHIWVQDTRNTIDFLICFKTVRKEGIAGLIEMGESNDLEFKSTLRWDLRAGKTSQLIERAVLKTVSAFMNSGGGTLLIGVRDDGSIEGIESDRFPNEDKFLLHFWTLVRTAFGRDVSMYIKTRLEKLGGKTICVVKCFRSQRPVFLKQPGFEEEFYIRVGPSSNALVVSEALKYISDHFSEK